MKGKRIKEEQIIRILHKAEGGLTVAEVCRKHNCSEQSFYRWKSKFPGARYDPRLGELASDLDVLRLYEEGWSMV